MPLIRIRGIFCPVSNFRCGCLARKCTSWPFSINASALNKVCTLGVCNARPNLILTSRSRVSTARISSGPSNFGVWDLLSATRKMVVGACVVTKASGVCMVCTVQPPSMGAWHALNPLGMSRLSIYVSMVSYWALKATSILLLKDLRLI